MILTHQEFKYRGSGRSKKGNEWKQGYILFPKKVAKNIGNEQVVSLIILKEGEDINYNELKEKVAEYNKFRKMEKEVERLKNKFFTKL